VADEAQIIYEYSAGSDVSIKTNDLKITYNRLFMTITARPDGKIYVDDPGIKQRIFTGTGIISGADMNELNTVQTAAITYSGLYPRIKKIYFAGAVFIENVEVVLDNGWSGSDLGNGFWEVSFSMTEKTD
jgi:hypothetical protein